MHNLFDPEHLYKIQSTTDKNKVLELDPHYTDTRFREEQTVYGAPEKGLYYDYSDRLQQFNYSKARESWNKAMDSGAIPKTCAFLEEYLSNYFDKPVEIKHIVSGVNRSNGYPYNVFGYRLIGEDS